MSSKQNNIINYILLAFIVAFTIHLLFNKLNKFKRDEKEVEVYKNVYKNVHKKTDEKYPTFKFIDYNKPSIEDKDSVYEQCPLPKNQQETNEYLTKYLLGNRQECPLPTKSKDQFRKDFFAFRDLTENSSSFRYDPVDKIQQLYLQGNLSKARRYPNIKIKDIFDSTTSTGPNLYMRHCVRLPKFDNINYDGYKMSYGAHPMHNTRDNWKYSNEKIINGGEISDGLIGHDLEDSKNMPYKKY
jgi:hypothetical protein